LTALKRVFQGLKREITQVFESIAVFVARWLWKPMQIQPLYAGSLYVGRHINEGLVNKGICFLSVKNVKVEEQHEVNYEFIRH
jgi:hypothetical protein